MIGRPSRHNHMLGGLQYIMISRMLLIIVTGLLASSCSRPFWQNSYNSANYLQSDTIAVNNFILRIENRFPSYADSSKKSLPMFNIQSDSAKTSNNNRQSPNPFSPTTTIELFLQHPDTIRMILYSFDGVDSCVVYSGLVLKGRNSINFVKPTMPSGIYYLIKRFRSGEKEVSRFMLLK